MVCESLEVLSGACAMVFMTCLLDHMKDILEYIIVRLIGCSLSSDDCLSAAPHG
jgi:hypothetical protein